MRLRLCLLLAASALASAAHPSAQAPAHPILVESPALATGEMMARDYTPDGRNVSPPLTWTNLPPQTKEIAVVCADFGAGNPPPWVHWVIYGIPPTANGLPEGIPIDPLTPMPPSISGARQGLNGWKRAIYRGPAPPAGKPHLYFFTVYALDAPLAIPRDRPPLTRAELLAAMEGHVIGQGQIVPIYQRR